VAADFPRLVSLACHDLRTPLATVQGFAKTLLRHEELDETTLRWLGLIDAASAELVDLLDSLSLAARIEGDRYEPITRQADTLALARAALPEAVGTGALVQVDPDAVMRALTGLARAAGRHGGVSITADVDGERIALQPVTAAAAPVILGEGDELRDLGAAVGIRVIRALGGSVELAGDRLLVTLPR